MIHGFMAKQNYGSTDWDIFFEKDNCVYFVEHESTHAWLTVNHEWTIDPLKALSFKTHMKAKIYAIENKLSGWIITEHEFI